MVTRIYDPDFILDDPSDVGLQALVDYTLSRPEVDPDKLAVLGVSMGGYKAGRIAQIDNRLKAVVANAPMLNAGKVLKATKTMIKMGKGALDYAMRFSWQYGVDIEAGKPKENVNKLVDEIWGSFQVDPTQITCPFLAMYGENELGEEGARQAREFYELLGSKTKVLRKTTEEEGAEAHCQLNNFGLQHQISYDFLDEVFHL
jgi:acetyl esterase/lipase